MAIMANLVFSVFIIVAIQTCASQLYMPSHFGATRYRANPLDNAQSPAPAPPTFHVSNFLSPRLAFLPVPVPMPIVSPRARANLVDQNSAVYIPSWVYARSTMQAPAALEDENETDPDPTPGAKPRCSSSLLGWFMGKKVESMIGGYDDYGSSSGLVSPTLPGPMVGTGALNSGMGQATTALHQAQMMESQVNNANQLLNSYGGNPMGHSFYRGDSAEDTSSPSPATSTVSPATSSSTLSPLPGNEPSTTSISAFDAVVI